MCYSFVYVGVFWGGCLANFQYIIMAAFNALGTRGAIFLLHQFRGLQVSFGLQGSRKPGLYDVDTSDIISLFQSTRLSRASTLRPGIIWLTITFQSTRLSRASTDWLPSEPPLPQYFNPQGSREPRRQPFGLCRYVRYFNPQGSREPRLLYRGISPCNPWISIHKALASLDLPECG